jgi:hypothetical protein
MQVAGGRSAGRSDEAELLAGGDSVAALDDRRIAHVHVDLARSIGGIDDDVVAAAPSYVAFETLPETAATTRRPHRARMSWPLWFRPPPKRFVSVPKS